MNWRRAAARHVHDVLFDERRAVKLDDVQQVTWHITSRRFAMCVCVCACLPGVCVCVRACQGGVSRGVYSTGGASVTENLGPEIEMRVLVHGGSRSPRKTSAASPELPLVVMHLAGVALIFGLLAASTQQLYLPGATLISALEG